MKIKKITALGLSALMAASLLGGNVFAADFTDQEVVAEAAGDYDYSAQYYKGVYYSWGLNEAGDGVILRTAWSDAKFPEVVEIPATRIVDGKEYPVKELAANLFEFKELKKVVMPDTITTLWAGAFAECKKLESVVFSKNLKIMYDSSFLNCTSLKSIVLPDRLEEVGISVFRGCSSLSSVTFGKGPLYLNLYSFKDCTALKKITIPRNVDRIFSWAFDGDKLTIYGYKGTRAESYAKNNDGIEFVALDGKSGSSTAIKGVTIKASNKTMTASASKSQTWTIGAKASNGGKLSYKSSSSKVKVSSAGKVTVPKKFAGKVKITIKTGKVSKTVTLTVKKAANPLKVLTKNQKIKASAVKKKAKTFRIKVTKAQGKVSYKSSNSKYVKVSGKGKVTVKKGCPKGTYKITVTAKGKGIYNKKSKTLTVRVK